MLKFNDNKPLVYIHLFKTGGTSLAKIFQDMYIPEKRFIKHNVYKNATEEVKKDTCRSEIIQQLKNIGIHNPVFQGHFERAPEYYFPEECTQFITTIRDPFDQVVSAFYHAKYKVKQPLNKIEQDIEGFILQRPYKFSLNKAFESKTKEEITLKNYKAILKKNFIAIGSLKNFKRTLHVFEEVLGKKIKNKHIHLNKNSAPESKYIVPKYLKPLHKELYPLEYEIYDWVNDFYNY